MGQVDDARRGFGNALYVSRQDTLFLNALIAGGNAWTSYKKAIARSRRNHEGRRRGRRRA